MAIFFSNDVNVSCSRSAGDNRLGVGLVGRSSKKERGGMSLDKSCIRGLRGIVGPLEVRVVAFCGCEVEVVVEAELPLL